MQYLKDIGHEIGYRIYTSLHKQKQRCTYTPFEGL
jgi:hypothetical protein